MQDDKISVKHVLNVYEKVVTFGQANDEGKVLSGLTALSGPDDYTIVLKNDYVSLAVFFHNTYQFNYTSQREKALFLEKIELINKTDYRQS